MLNKNKFIKSDYLAYCWLFPAILLILAFSFYPAISALLHSFTEWDLENTKFIAFDNFIKLFNDNIFWKSCFNLIILIGTGLVFGNLSAIFLAQLLHNMNSKKASSAYRFIFILPALVPGMVSMLLWTKIIFNPSDTGLINTLFINIGLNPLKWYDSEKTALVSLILTGFPWVAGTSFLIYLAGLNNIPESVYEAAKLDGANTFTRILAIDLPLIKSQIKYFIMMGIIGGMQSFSMQLVFTFGGPNYATTVPGYHMYQTAFFSGEFGYAASMGMFLFVITLVLTIFNNKYMKSTEEI